jgi:hypothetical protein
MKLRLSILAVFALLLTVPVFAQTQISGKVVKNGTLPVAAIDATGSPSSSNLLTGDAAWTALGGDLTGSPGSVTVQGLQTRSISAATPSAGDVLQYSGSQWVPSTLGGFSVFLGQATVVATTNQALTGTPTIDGVGTAAGSVVLCTAQTITSQNGPWSIPVGGGSWTRPVWYSPGLTISYGRIIWVSQGTSTTGYLRTFWVMTTGGGPVVDTDGTAWTQMEWSVQNAIVGLLHLANGGTNSDLSGTGPGVLKQASSGAVVTVGTVDLSSGSYVTNTLGVPNGGTGASTLTAHGPLIGAGASAVASMSAGSAGQIVRSGGASADPSWSTATYPATAGSSGNVLTSDGTNWVSSAPTGGFTNPMTTLGDLIYENSTPAAARLPGNTTSTKNFLTQTGTGSVSAAPSWGTIAAADVPNLDASKITTGQLALARGGTNADLSGTGGSHQYLKQSSTGAAVTVGQPAFTDLSGNITTSQMNSGTGASSSTFFRGDGTWASVSASGDTGYEIFGAGTTYALTQSYGAVSFASTLQVTLPTAGQSYVVTAYLDITESTSASDDVRALFYDSTTGLFVANSERRVSYMPASSRGVVVLEKVITPANNNEVIQVYAVNATAARGGVTSYRSKMSYKTLGVATSTVMSNSFTPSSISGLVSWYDASNISSPPSNGGTLTTWNDLGTAALNLTAGATKPTYQTGVLNGLPVVRFTGSTNGMTNATNSTTSSSFTMFVVCSVSSSSTNAVVFKNGSGGVNGEQINLGTQSNLQYAFAANLGGAGEFGATSGIAPNNGWVLLEFKRSAGTSTFLINNVSKGTSSGTFTSPTGGLVLGSSSVIDIGEVQLFNTALGSTDETNVIAYLNSKWGFLM